MLTVSQLADIFFVLLTLQLIQKQVFIEINDKTATFIKRVYRNLSETSLLVMAIASAMMLIAPNRPASAEFMANMALLALELAVIVTVPLSYLAEVADFYQKYALEHPKKYIVGAIQLGISVLFIYLILR